MLVDQPWYNDVEQYIPLTSGDPKMVSCAYREASSRFEENDLWQVSGFHDQLRVNKQAWEEYSAKEQLVIKSYFAGFADGFEQAQF